MTKLIILQVDPWVNIDRKKEFNLPENFFVAEGEVCKPSVNQKGQLGIFADDKIKTIEFLSQTKKSAALVIQYNTALICISMNKFQS